MDYGVIWVIIIIAVFLFNLFSKSEDSSSDVQQFVSDNPFSIKVKRGMPPTETGIKIDCFNIEMRGMINHPSEDEVKVILTLQDVTDNEEEAGLPVVSAHHVFSEPNSRVFGFHQNVRTGTDSYYPDWIKYTSVPLDFIIPPHKGSRKIKFLLFVCDSDTEIRQGHLEDTHKVKHLATQIVNFSFKEPGYMDELVNRDKVEDLTIKLGMSMAAVDGHLDQKELNVIKSWVKNLTNLLEEDKAEERKKHFSKFVKSAYTAAKDKKISLSNLVKEFNDIASKSQKYTAMQLLLDISGADGTLSKEEDVFINKIAKTTGINLATFKEMKNKVIANVDNIDLSEKPSEEFFGVTEDMDDKQKCKVLRKEFTKWNGQTNHNNIKKRKRAKEMVKIIANLRKQYNC